MSFRRVNHCMNRYEHRNWWTDEKTWKTQQTDRYVHAYIYTYVCEYTHVYIYTCNYIYIHTLLVAVFYTILIVFVIILVTLMINNSVAFYCIFHCIYTPPSLDWEPAKMQKSQESCGLEYCNARTRWPAFEHDSGAGRAAVRDWGLGFPSTVGFW